MTITSNDIRQKIYTSATTINQDFLDKTFGYGETKLQAVCEITNGSNVIKVSSIPKYVGDVYYEGRASLPVIRKTIGQFLTTTFQFDDTNIQLSNVDGALNKYFINGENYNTFIGSQMIFKLGVDDIESSYINVFTGEIKNESGLASSTQTVEFNAQNILTNYNRTIDLPEIKSSVFPSAPTDVLGTKIPVVIGDWTIGCNVILTGSYKVNSSGVDYDAETYTTNNFYGGVLGYYIGGANFVFATGNYTPSTISNAWLKRGDKLLALNFNSTPQVVGGYYVCNITNIKKSGGGTITYVYEQGDQLVISVNVGSNDNIVNQAKSLLQDILGISSSLFDSSWTILSAKASPSQSSISTIKSRVWIGENSGTILEYVNSMLTQVRLKFFINSNGLFELLSLHFEDWQTPSSLRKIDKFQVIEDSIKITSDDQNYICGASGNYSFTPVSSSTMLKSPLLINQTSKNAIGGTNVLKTIDFPNLYIASDVANQLTEYIRLFSFPLEYVTLSTAWTGLLDDIGDFINIDIQIGSINYINVPCIIMDKSIDLQTFKIQYKLLSLNGFSYPNNVLSLTGMLSSYNQTLS